MHAYKHSTPMHLCIHTYIHTYIHTCIQAKAGLLRRVTNIPIPYGDLKKKHLCPLKMQMAVNNKLHAIHPQPGLWPGGFRIIRHQESVLAASIRIGHTHLTYSFL